MRPSGARTSVALAGLLVAIGTGLLSASATSAGTATGSALSPKGLVAFDSNRDGSYRIFTMTARGTVQTPLTPNSGSRYDPAWAPNGRRISLTSGQETSPFDQDIEVMNRDGSDRIPLTTNDVEDYNAVFTPDGRRILWIQAGDIWVMNSNGSNQRALVTDGDDNRGPDLSPNGRRVIFTRDDGTDQEIWIALANGGAQRQLTDDDFDQRSPKFSPDGRWILFTSDSDGDNEIYRMPAAGGDTVQLTFTGGGPSGSDRGAAFSRDGLRRIYWVSNRDADNDAEIFVMNFDGSNPRQLTFNTSDDLSPAPQPAISCLGRKATIIGTNGRDTLVGGRGRDVIAGLGANDKLRGLGRRDLLCGGRGNDRLFGGKANDRLNAGAGRRDRCFGGAGRRDRRRGCELGRG